MNFGTKQSYTFYLFVGEAELVTGNTPLMVGSSNLTLFDTFTFE